MTAVAGPQLRFVIFLTEIGCVTNCLIIIIISVWKPAVQPVLAWRNGRKTMMMMMMMMFGTSELNKLRLCT